MAAPYSAYHLPEFDPATQGLIALPRDTEFACVVAPRTVLLQGTPSPDEPKGVHTYWPNSHQFAMNMHELHMLLDNAGRHAPALDAVLGPEGTYEITNPDLRPEDDPRAALMHAIWTQHGVRPTVMLMRRCAPINVLGQLPEGSRAAGERLGDGHTPYATLTARCFVVVGARSVVEVVRANDMHQMFHALAQPGGEVVRQLVPA